MLHQNTSTMISLQLQNCISDKVPFASCLVICGLMVGITFHAMMACSWKCGKVLGIPVRFVDLTNHETHHTFETACIVSSVQASWLQAVPGAERAERVDPQSFQASTAAELTYGKDKARQMLDLKRDSGGADQSGSLSQPQDVTGASTF